MLSSQGRWWVRKRPAHTWACGMLVRADSAWYQPPVLLASYSLTPQALVEGVPLQSLRAPARPLWDCRLQCMGSKVPAERRKVRGDVYVPGLNTCPRSIGATYMQGGWKVTPSSDSGEKVDAAVNTQHCLCHTGPRTHRYHDCDQASRPSLDWDEVRLRSCGHWSSVWRN